MERIDHKLQEILADVRCIKLSQDRMERWLPDLRLPTKFDELKLPGKFDTEVAAQKHEEYTKEEACMEIVSSVSKNRDSAYSSTDNIPIPSTTSFTSAWQGHAHPTPDMHQLYHAFADDDGPKYLKPHMEQTSSLNLGSKGSGSKGGKFSPRISGRRRSSLRLYSNATNIFEKIVFHPHFEKVAAFFILFHSAFIAAYVQCLSDTRGDPPIFWPVLNQILVFFFVVEVALKIGANKRSFCVGHERSWNIFDVVLITLVFVELVVKILTSGLDDHRKYVKKMLKMGEVIRTFRVLRIFRVLRFSAPLRTIISKIHNSMKTLFWVMVLIIMLIFVAAVCFTNGATHYLDDTEENNNDVGEEHEVKKNFGSVPKSFYTVFQSISGGIQWAQAADSLQAMSEVYFYMFLAYIAITFFAILNIITGIFVDAALQTALTERDLIMERQAEFESVSVEHLREMFFDMDLEEDGLLLIEQFRLCLQDENIRAFLHALKIDTSDAAQLFRLLDLDNSGEILIDEFVEGCMKLRGDAKSMDIHIMMCENRRMWAKFGVFAKELCDSLTHINQAIGKSNMAPTLDLPPLPIMPPMFGSRMGSRRPSIAQSVQGSVVCSARNSFTSPPSTATSFRPQVGGGTLSFFGIAEGQKGTSSNEARRFVSPERSERSSSIERRACSPDSRDDINCVHSISSVVEAPKDKTCNILPKAGQTVLPFCPQE